MSEAADKNIERYRVDRYPLRDDANRFCIQGLIAYRSDEERLMGKRDDLLTSLSDEFATSVQTVECTLGECAVELRQNDPQGQLFQDM